MGDSHGCAKRWPSRDMNYSGTVVVGPTRSGLEACTQVEHHRHARIVAHSIRSVRTNSSPW
jgi:hypothetical protein